MEFLRHDQLVFVFGLLGNIVAFLVFLAPVPTFYRIYKMKSSKGFQSIPYVGALMSTTILLYYGLLKTNAIFIIIINAIGCTIEVIYIILYLIFAETKERMFTMKLLLFLSMSFGLMVALTHFLVKSSHRVFVVGGISSAYTFAVFASPLSIMRRVIMTKSVEYMPFALSFFLTLNAVVWFAYGLLIRDLFVALPNVLGLLCGIAQTILYIKYKVGKEDVETKSKWNTGSTVNAENSTPKNDPNEPDIEMKIYASSVHLIRTNENNI